MPLKLWWLALVALGLQYGVLELSKGALISDALLRIGIGISYLMLLLVIVCNLRWLGMRLLGIGVALNFVVMAANGGLMPVTPHALDQTIYDESAEHDHVTGLIPGSKSILLRRDETTLWWLSDVLVLPGNVPGPKVISIGDVLLAAGLISLSYTGARLAFDASGSGTVYIPPKKVAGVVRQSGQTSSHNHNGISESSPRRHAISRPEVGNRKMNS